MVGAPDFAGIRRFLHRDDREWMNTLALEPPESMIDLYTAATPNGRKISVALEELELAYRVVTLDLGAGEQKSPEFLRINPNGRIPAIVDRDEDDFAVFESGAILIYLAEKTGRLLPADPKRRSEVIQWLMFQMGGVGPMQGQAGVFTRYFPEKIPAAIERYQNETRRLYEVLDGQLARSESKGGSFICGEFSIADIATWPWVRSHAWSGISIEGLRHIESWLRIMESRPACARGIETPPSSVEPEERIRRVQRFLQR